MRPMFIAFLAAVALLAAAAPAPRAAELLDASRQINPKNDPADSILSWDLIPDDRNGFTVVWSKDGADEDLEPEQLHARLVRSTLKPAGAPVRYDGKVGGATPDSVALFGSAMLGGGKLVSVWEARFAGAPSQGLAQFFAGGKPAGKPKSVENDDAVSMLFARQLGDGRAVVPWIADGGASELSGRFVLANGKLGPANLTFTLGPDSFFPTLYALDEGLLAVAYRETGGGKELAGQVYDAEGAREGESFTLAPPSAAFQQVSNVVGLASGDIALVTCRQDGAEPCDLKGQIFKRGGGKRGGTATLVKSFGPAPVAVTALSGSDFLLTSVEGVGAGTRIVFRRFDGKLKLVGPIARTRPRSGLRRGAVRLLANGRVAASYVVNGSALFVQLVKP